MNELKGKPLSIENVQVSFIDVPNHVSATIFFNGCIMKCSYCHNPNLHTYKPDKETSLTDIINTLITYDELIDTVCLMGGEPLMQDNKKLEQLIDEVRKLKLSVCLYTAYEKEEVPSSILDKIDMLKTGKFIPELNAGGFLASSNQNYYTKEKGEWIKW